MKIRTIKKRYIRAAVVFSAGYLLAGCKADAAGKIQTVQDTAEEVSNPTELVIELEGKEENPGEDNPTELVIEPEGKEENPGEDTEDAEKESEAAGNIRIYDDILAEYSDMVQNDFFMALRDSDAYDSSFGENIGLEIRTHKQDIYYTFYDIDGNGTKELMIGGGELGVSNPAFSPWNYDLYGYDGEKAVPIFPEMEFGYRTNFSLFENGVIEVFYSGSAAETGVDFYRIGSDGVTPELVDSFLTVGHLEGDQPVFNYSQNGEEITEEEYQARLQSYEVPLAESLDWIQVQ